MCLPEKRRIFITTPGESRKSSYGTMGRQTDRSCEEELYSTLTTITGILHPCVRILQYRGDENRKHVQHLLCFLPSLRACFGYKTRTKIVYMNILVSNDGMVQEITLDTKIIFKEFKQIHQGSKDLWMFLSQQWLNLVLHNGVL